MQENMLLDEWPASRLHASGSSAEIEIPIRPEVIRSRIQVGPPERSLLKRKGLVV